MAKSEHKDERNDELILEPDLSITFGNKALLRRSEETGIPLEDEKVIAVMEGDMAAEKLNKELFEGYAGTKIQPDPEIVYPDHASLKKKAAIIPATAWYAAAAAILLLVSIGALITFMPGASPDRTRQTLTLIETRQARLEGISSLSITYDFSAGESKMITAREEHTLAKTAKRDPDPFQTQYALSISDKMSVLSPLNSQYLAPSTLEYAQAEPKQRTLIGKVFSGMFNRVKEPFERNEASAKPAPSDGFSFWDLAELGVKGMNTLGDHDYKVLRNYDEKGNVTGITLMSE